MNQKTLLIVLALIFFARIGFGQHVPFDTLLNRAKAEFKRDSDMASYRVAVEKFEQVVALRPDNAEAHYFLAYSYARSNTQDASTDPGMKLSLVIKASEQLEKTIQLSPAYTGENIILDPYSKLTSEWGAMALSCVTNHKIDSAIWVLKEGKRRGGFDDFILSQCRMVFNSCSRNSTLFTSGDNYFFPMLYLQLVEKMRLDISVMDTGLINTKWFPRLLMENGSVQFDLKEPALDTIDYKAWSDSTISIPVSGTGKYFSWVVKPSYQNNYILRSDRILLSFLKENKFKRDIYFTQGYRIDEILSLEEKFLELPVVYKVNALDEPQPTNEKFIADFKSLMMDLRPANKNAPDELVTIACIRYTLYTRINRYLDNGDKDGAKALVNLLNNYLPAKDYPLLETDEKELGEITEKFLQN